MKSIAMWAFTAAILVAMATEGDAACCWPNFKFKVSITGSADVYLTGCGDCTDPTPYCGYGKCNIFGCNCDGGCRRGGCPNSAPAMFSPTPNTVVDAASFLAAADENGDGRVSIEEAYKFLSVKEHVVGFQAVKAMDSDGDGFLSVEDIEA